MSKYHDFLRERLLEMSEEEREEFWFTRFVISKIRPDLSIDDITICMIAEGDKDYGIEPDLSFLQDRISSKELWSPEIQAFFRSQLNELAERASGVKREKAGGPKRRYNPFEVTYHIHFQMESGLGKDKSVISAVELFGIDRDYAYKIFDENIDDVRAFYDFLQPFREEWEQLKKSFSETAEGTESR